MQFPGEARNAYANRWLSAGSRRCAGHRLEGIITLLVDSGAVHCRIMIAFLLVMSPEMDHRARLKELLRRKSVVRGSFTLASGETSDYYIDCKLTTLDPEGAVLTGHTVLDLLEQEGIQADAIGGPPIGAHPIVTAVAAVSYLRGRP